MSFKSAPNQSSFALFLLALGLASVASASTPPCAECLDEKFYNSSTNRSYVLIATDDNSGGCNNQDRGWDHSELLAQLRFGVHLVTIETQEEHQWIVDNIWPVIGDEMWIGLRANSSCTPFWVDGTPVDFLYFDPGVSNQCATQCNESDVRYGLISWPGPQHYWKYTVRWAQCCYAVPIPGLVEIPCFDEIIHQPRDASAGCGEVAKFHVALPDVDLPYDRVIQYQWRKDGEIILSLDNQTEPTSSLVIRDVCTADAGVYDCIITTTCREAFASQPTMLTVSTCCSDFDSSGTVDVADLLVLLAAWGSCEDCIADVDCDGAVGTDDLLLLLSAWGECV